MLKTDTKAAIKNLNDSLVNFSSNYYVKIHRMYQPRPVSPNWEITRNRIIKDLHMLFVIDGKGTYTLGSEKIPMKKGQLFIVSNNYPHSAVTDQEDLIHMFSLRMGIYSIQTDKFISDFFKEPFGLCITPKDSGLYKSLFRRVHHYFLEKKPISQFAINNLMCQVLLNLTEEATLQSNSMYIQDITEDIIRHHGKDISIGVLADKIQLSIKQFTRLFVSENHITPHQFIIHTRINHAMYLLDETGLTIKAVALELGYADAFTFSRQFKQLTGKSPSIYRK